MIFTLLNLEKDQKYCFKSIFSNRAVCYKDVACPVRYVMAKIYIEDELYDKVVEFREEAKITMSKIDLFWISFFVLIFFVLDITDMIKQRLGIEMLCQNVTIILSYRWYVPQHQQAPLKSWQWRIYCRIWWKYSAPQVNTFLNNYLMKY